MMKYKVFVYALSEDKEMALVGSTDVEAPNEKSASELAIEELWNPRFDCASCSPRVIVERI